MKLLFVHADRIWYKVGRKTKMAEKLPENMKEDEMTDCILAFSCVEKFDELKPKETVRLIVDEITNVGKKLKTKRVMLFPFAHLSKYLSSPEMAVEILKDAEESLKKIGFEVKRAPFGWNKKFELKSKGHPLAILSRTVCPITEECK